MGHYRVEVSEIVQASPDQVYAIVSDYHQGHPSILPPRYFKEMSVVRGGQGAGTVAAVRMNVFGAEAEYEMTVSEPEPGRVLVEQDITAGVHTTFTLDPVDGGDQTQVTITTETRLSPGLRGLVEKVLNPPITRMIYQAELRQLAGVLQGNGNKS